MRLAGQRLEYEHELHTKLRIVIALLQPDDRAQPLKMSEPPLVRLLISALGQHDRKERTKRRQRLLEAGVEFAAKLIVVEHIVGVVLVILLPFTDERDRLH